ncbi:hypothetical protein N6H14_28905 [Paenibacillus sp. CC-CFT747]|nr:hypothetical protein N6H14_28905 [Paenibacillus sp. CC-CFT747]
MKENLAETRHLDKPRLHAVSRTAVKPATRPLPPRAETVTSLKSAA